MKFKYKCDLAHFVFLHDAVWERGPSWAVATGLELIASLQKPARGRVPNSYLKPVHGRIVDPCEVV